MTSPHYYAVIFTSLRRENSPGYEEMARAMEALARKQPGFLGMEHARQELGITVSYWENREAIAAWKRHATHQFAQERGKEDWYAWYRIRVCRVERDYEFKS
ncbi:antibiotic biosynthesis monooxygenase family protein [Maribacter sp. 2307ULW6-5]|uniref:antibiotic biosynthesis monooxygenase family protein n=1 Tax=Maribacter sp. 2307ULW6-5 TaxID=3386275 RepID=UPI0039BC50F5